MGLVMILAGAGRTTVAQGVASPSVPSSSLPASPGGGGTHPSHVPSSISAPLASVFPAGDLPVAAGRPRPGSLFDPGASGPGISQEGGENLLDGAFDPKTGWPFVLLDHFRPRPERVEGLWLVIARDCPQVMGTDPWAKLKFLQFNAEGVLVERPWAALQAQLTTRPAMVVVEGNLANREVCLGGLLWTHSWLQANRALPSNAVVINFDWPSERVYKLDVRDVNEKGRRAFVGGYHLARFLQAFPQGCRVGLVGQSYGSRVVLSTLHLLGGGGLNSMSHDPEVKLPQAGSAACVRATIIAGAADHDNLLPGHRYSRALYGCEGLLNLYNSEDEALILYPFLIRSDHHRALGRIGMTSRDFRRLDSAAAARYHEHDLADILGAEHTLLDAVANPKISRWMAPYLWAPDPGPRPVPASNSRSTPFERAHRSFKFFK